MIMDLFEKFRVTQSLEHQYADALKYVLSAGTLSENRTGIDTLVHQHFYFQIKDVAGNFPILKGKKLFPHMALTEMLWFLQGRTDIKWLNDHKVNYWNSWQNDKGTIGKSYGYQFRNFNGVDQVDNVLNMLQNTPMSRRMIINLWNAGDITEMELEPCVYDYHFECTKASEKVIFMDLHVKQRSADMFLGVPYDFMLVGWIMKIFSEYLNQLNMGNVYIPRNVHYTTDNSHIYVNHKSQVEQYLHNVLDNKNSVIDSIMYVGFKLEKQHTNFDSFIGEIIDSWDGSKYSKVIIDKGYADVYPQIKAPVAV